MVAIKIARHKAFLARRLSSFFLCRYDDEGLRVGAVVQNNMLGRSSISRLLLISCCVTQRNFASSFSVPTVQMHRSCLSSTAAAATTTTDDSGDFRILCLHGKGGNGEEFLKRLIPLRALLNDSLADSNVSIKWEALTAPYQISETDDAYAWWTMSPGVRSFNAEEYI